MNIVEYTFQSQYPSPFQVGKIDLASVKNSAQNNTIPKENNAEQDSSIDSIVSSQEELQELQMMENNSVSSYSDPFQEENIDFNSVQNNSIDSLVSSEEQLQELQIMDNKVAQNDSMSSILSSQEELQELQIIDNNSTSPFILDEYA